MRQLIRWVTLAACVPYIVLKVLWLTGHPVGAASVADRAVLVDADHRAGNAVTLAMELVAVVLVLAFTSEWGQRLPASVVLVPVWVGTGLLVPLALGLPVGLLAQAVAGGSPAPADSGMRPWVFATVYGGFGIQAAGLVAAFALHARRRWPSVFTLRVGGLSVARGLQVTLAQGAAVLAVGCGMVHLVWAAGPVRADGFETVAQRTFLGVHGVLMLAGAVGVVGLVRRWGQRRRLLGPVVVAWVGAGVTFGSGLGTTDSSLGQLAALAGALAGALLGVACLLRLERPAQAAS